MGYLIRGREWPISVGGLEEPREDRLHETARIPRCTISTGTISRASADRPGRSTPAVRGLSLGLLLTGGCGLSAYRPTPPSQREDGRLVISAEIRACLVSKGAKLTDAPDGGVVLRNTPATRKAMAETLAILARRMRLSTENIARANEGASPGADRPDQPKHLIITADGEAREVAHASAGERSPGVSVFDEALVHHRSAVQYEFLLAALRRFRGRPSRSGASLAHGTGK